MVTARADSYSVASGAGVYAGIAPPAALSSMRIALFGDSNTAYAGYNNSPVFWINGLAARGALQIVANAGVPAETVGDMLARVNNAYTASSPGLAGLAPLGAVFVCVGTNNARAGNSWASILSTVVSLLSAIKSYCDHVYILAVPPIGPSESSYASKNALTLDYNVGFAAIAAASPSSYTYVALDADIRNGDGSQLAGTFNADGVHPIGTGVYLQGKRGGTLLASPFAAMNLASPLITDPAYVYPAQGQWVSNHVMAGTGGSVGSGWSGQVANAWGVGSNGSGIGGTVAKVAADVGDPNQVPYQFIYPTSVARTGSGESVRATHTLVGPTITTSYPAALDFMLDVRMAAFDTTRFSGLMAWVQGAGGSLLTPYMELKMGGAIVTEGSVVLRQKLPRLTAVAESGATLYIDLVISQNYSGSMGGIGFRCPAVLG